MIQPTRVVRASWLNHWIDGVIPSTTTKLHVQGPKHELCNPLLSQSFLGVSSRGKENSLSQIISAHL